MSLLDPRVWLAAVLALGLAYFSGRWQQSGHDKASYAAERTNAALSAAVDQVKAVDRARAEEQRRTTVQLEIANEAKKDADSARADAVVADAAAERLRKRVDELLAAVRAGQNPAPIGAGQSQPGGDPLDVLVDVLRRTDDAAGQFGTYADQLKIAGVACERSYDALMNAN